MEFLPDIMRFEDGTYISSAADWEKRRAEVMDILHREIYGYPPRTRSAGRGEVTGTEKTVASGHATLEKIRITAETDRGDYSFPMHVFWPKTEGKCPLFVMLNFHPDVYDKYYPAEEIVDNGFAVAVICYEDIVSDDGDWSDGIAAYFDRPSDGTGFGKIALWAWGASRALDYLLTRPETDEKHVGIIGHSRLGKTALLCAAEDKRFGYAFSNDSGCAGAALEKCKHTGGETVRDITRNFPYWFCENYRKYVGKPEQMPFDQHFLVSAIAPRYVSVHSASQDAWADPVGEQLCCVAASPVWRLLGKKGFAGTEKPAETGADYPDGDIGYYLRDGIHFLGRMDWLKDMAFMRRHWE